MGRYISSDLAWLAVDAVGHLAAFTTAGVAPIPSTVLDHPDLAEWSEGLVHCLRLIGEAELFEDLPRADDFLAFARRGWFVYDWQDVHRTSEKTGCYELIAQPQVPRRLADLLGHLRQAAELVVLPKIRFAECRLIDVRPLVACEVA